MATVPRPILKSSSGASSSRSHHGSHSSRASSGSNNAHKTRLTTERVPPNFRVDYRYTNALPDPPADAKFLPYPFPSDYLYGYTHTTLEKSYKYRLHMQPTVPLGADVVDPFGCEEWTRLAEQDEKDRFLLRKDGAESSIGGRVQKSRLEGAEYKPWLQKTIYTAPSIHDTERRSAPQTFAEESDVRRADPAFVRAEFAASARLVPTPPRPGLVLRRSVQVVPAAAKRPQLSGMTIYLVRFDPRERIAEDPRTARDEPAVEAAGEEARVARAVLARRCVRPPKRGPIAGRLPPKNPFSPASLVLPNDAEGATSAKKNKPDEDDDIFGDDDDDEPTKPAEAAAPASTGTLVRDYGVEVIKEQGQRILLTFDAESKYAEMIPVDPLSLRCSRVKTVDAAAREAQGPVQLVARPAREGEEWATAIA